LSSGKTSLERISEIAKYANELGIDSASKLLGLSRETIRRSIRNYNSGKRETPAEPLASNDSLYKKLCERFSPAELSAIANGKALNPSGVARPVIDFDGEDVCIGFVTDTHIGGKEFGDSLWVSFLKECEREGVEMILHAGDVHEGMSNRPEQVYNLNDIGVSAQMEHSREIFGMTDIPIKVIDGNHDRWGIKSNGLFMVRDLCEQVPNAEFIGCDIGEVVINGSRWMLWHGEDGSSYATSYRVQKLIESFTGGSKPHVLLCGHTHKQGYFFERNVHAVSGGALSYQSDWMRSTRKACHTGFHIIRAKIKDGQIVRFSPTFYPFYN
jgi:predicted phosphodiesterase